MATSEEAADGNTQGDQWPPDPSDEDIQAIRDILKGDGIKRDRDGIGDFLPAFTTEISTQRLLLRKARVEDLAALFDILRRGNVKQFREWPPHRNIRETKAWLNGIRNSSYNGVTEFVVELRALPDGAMARNRVIGRVGCMGGEVLDYYLHPAYWGKGYESEAVDALLQHVWFITTVPDVCAYCDEEDTVGLGMLMGKGFVVTERFYRSSHRGRRDVLGLRLKRQS